MAVLGIASGDGCKNRVALRNIVVMAARVCLKLMVSSNKPAVFASVADLVEFLRAQFGYGVSTEVTRKILSKCKAFTFLHSGEVQNLRDNCPE